MARTTSDTSVLAGQRLIQLAEALEKAEPKLARGELARRLGVDPSYLSRLMKSESASIGLETMESVCRTFGIDRAYFSEHPERNDVDHRAYIRRELGTLLVAPLTRPDRDGRTGPEIVADMYATKVANGTAKAEDARTLVELVLKDRVVAAAADARESPERALRELQFVERELQKARHFLKNVLPEVLEQGAIEESEARIRHLESYRARLQSEAAGSEMISKTAHLANLIIRTQWGGKLGDGDSVHVRARPPIVVLQEDGKPVGYRLVSPKDGPSVLRYAYEGQEYVMEDEGTALVANSPLIWTAIAERKLELIKF